MVYGKVIMKKKLEHQNLELEKQQVEGGFMEKKVFKKKKVLKEKKNLLKEKKKVIRKNVKMNVRLYL